MVQPINYMAQIPQPDIGQSLISGLELGVNFRAAQQKQLAAEQALAAKMQFSADVAAAMANGSQKAMLGLIAKYPGAREAFNDVRKGMEEEQVKNEFFSGFEISNALEAGQPLVAAEKLKAIIAAKKNAGQPAGLHEQALSVIESGDIKRAQSGINLILLAADPDRFEKTVKAKAAPQTQDATLKELEAKAISAGVDAEFAKPKAVAELAKTRAETLAPAIRESIDFENLTPEQQRTFQGLQILKKPPAAVTNVNVSNIDKTAAAELGKLVPDLYNQANSAAEQVVELPRYKAALDSAITGPFAEQRLSATRIAGALGFGGGDKAANATREVIQGLSEMALKSRGMLSGQGQLTDFEQKLLIKARSGDISFTKGELTTIFDVAKRAAEAQYKQSRKLLESASKESPTARMFLENMQTMESKGPPTVTVGGKTFSRPASFTDDQWNAYKKSVGAK